MYLDIVPNRNSPPCILLREAFRDKDGKVRKKTISNLSGHISLEQAAQIRHILKNAAPAAGALSEAFEVRSAIAHGHVQAVLDTMHQIKIPALLARSASPERRNAMALIAGRIIFPGSKLALSRYLNSGVSTLARELQLSPKSTEDDLYLAMKWLGQRQHQIETRLARKHLDHGTVVLYDMSSSWYEGTHCPLAARGYSRDGKKGSLQINYGLLVNRQGCPISIEAYRGDTADPMTVADQLEKLRQRFNLSRVIVVGDRGMLTRARLDAAGEDPSLQDYGWISALDSDQIRTLSREGAIQMELFDQRNLAEITSPSFPGERLVVCRNPELAQRRDYKRQDLIRATTQALENIQKATRRTRNPYHGKDRIARRVEREVGKYRMLKHFRLQIEETDLIFELNETSVAEEARMDGFYVVRARNVGPEEMGERELVETYKSLTHVERGFRTIKTQGLKVRPIFHRAEDMVRAHLFVCMLAWHVRWHMERKLRPILFSDEELETQKAKRENPVGKTELSGKAKRKKAKGETEDGLKVQSFETLLEVLSSHSLCVFQPKVEGAGTFEKYTMLTDLQRKAYELLGIKPRI